MEWPVLACLAPHERAEVLATARRRRFSRGEAVVREGDPSDSLHLVASGMLVVRVGTDGGEWAALNILGPGAYFGELSLLGDSRRTRSADVVALEPTETLVLSVATFAGLRAKNPAMQELLLALLARRVEELSSRLAEAMHDNLDRRVYRRLSELTAVYAGGSDGSVCVPLTQELIAQLAGGTRPSVNQLLQRLVAQGIIELGRGRVTVLRPDALARKAR